MLFVSASSPSLVVFGGVLLWVVGCLIAGVYFASRALGGPARARAFVTAALVALWLALLSTIVASGAIAEAPMPRLMLFFLASNLGAIALALSPAGGWMARGLPLTALIGFQAFRLPLELVLHEWVVQGVIPQTMTWTGQNYDIVSGALAIVAALFGARWPIAVRAANVVGLALLGNVARVAILSSPLPFAWGVEPPLQLAFHLPYALIVPVCMSGALAGHLVLIRALLWRRRAGTAVDNSHTK